MIEIIAARMIPKADNPDYEEYCAFREILNMSIGEFIYKMRKLYPNAEIEEDRENDWDIIIGDKNGAHLYINAVKTDEITFEQITSYADEFVKEV